MKQRITAALICFCILFSFCACDQIEQPSDTGTIAVTTEATLAPFTVQAVSEEVRIRVAAAGDNIPHDSVIETARTDATGGSEYNFSEIYAGIADIIGGADIAFVNQESPVGGAELGISGYPNFNAPREMVEELIEIGFDVFNIANNHMLDKGEKGYGNTIEYFNSLPVTMIGGYTKSDYDEIRIVEEQGVKIAFLSYTTLVNAGHKNDLSASSRYIVPYADTADITRQVGLAKAQADAVIVSFHWGTENEFGVTAEQQKYAKLCADLGVDVVLGHHSHVVGGVEYLTGESGNKTLVAYSLGNLCSTMLYAKNMVGEILSFDIVKSADGVITIENAQVDPVVSHYKTDTSKKDNQNLHVRYASRVYLMRNYTEALANEHGSQNWGAFTFADLKKYITDNTSSEFLPMYMQ
ncbi:MAG: CapA family protein [Clostridia bacterium]|nr:CapA family protein [Clostridia bacterium]